MKGGYIFMLASWFPNQLEPTAGNFIKSHIDTIGISNNVILLYIKFIDRKQICNDTEEQVGNVLYITKYIAKPNSNITKFFIYYNYCLQIIKKHGTPRFIQVHVGWPTGIVAWLLKKLKHIPYIITEHSSKYLQVNRPKTNYIERKVYCDAKGITAVSPHLANDMNQLFSLQKTPTIIPNLVDDFIYHIPKQNVKENYFIHVSNFATLKQSIKIVEAFIEAQPQIPDPIAIGYRLYMYGEDGTDKEACRELARKHGLLYRSIFIEGVLPKTEIAEKISKAAALISYSLYETQGMTVYEALAVHCPVICNNINAFDKLISPEIGILVQSDAELCTAMIELAEGKQKINFANYKELYDSKTINTLFNNYYKELNLV